MTHFYRVLALILVVFFGVLPEGICQPPASAPTPGAGRKPGPIMRIPGATLQGTATAKQTSSSQEMPLPPAPVTKFNQWRRTLVWLVPFVYLAVVLTVYLFTPESRREDVQKRMVKNLNFYLGCGVVLVFLTLIAVASDYAWRSRVLAIVDWLVLLMLAVLSVRKAIAVEVEPEVLKGPL